MKKSTFMLLPLALLFCILTSRADAGMPCAAPTAQDKACAIEDISKIDLETLADIMQSCRFELPNSIRLHTPRHEELVQPGRMSYSSKTANTCATLQLQQKYSHKFQESHKAIAASRHIRGYYIYTLRHIII